jgi:lactobin A/cerein 7B family class IIb bacteriocin
MQVLTTQQVESVNGGGDGANMAIGFLAIAVGGAAVLTPVGMGVFLGASIISSAIDIYTQLQ